jgi:RNA polymerase sigma factor (sigma-70 family)
MSVGIDLRERQIMINGHKVPAGGPYRLPAGGISGEEPSDGQLLQQFVRFGDQGAFGVLVRRHGPMVLGVCRRVLRHAHDAEDAFQATFLVLVHKAATLAQPNLLAAWLHGVAYRTALHARSRTILRGQREREAASMSPTATGPDNTWSDLREHLDEELQGLPEHYRAPLVLCYLEGKTNIDAARMLGWPAGSISSRLNRARELLRDRLTQGDDEDRRRRRALPVLLFLGLLTRNLEPVTVPGSLVDATIDAGLQLAGGAATSLTSEAVEALMQASLQTVPAKSGRRLGLWWAAGLALLLLLAGTAAAWGSGSILQQLFPRGVSSGQSCHP